MSARRGSLDLARLKELDPAGPPDADAAASVAARAMLERVVATPRETSPRTAGSGDLPAGVIPAARPAPRRIRARLALAGGAVAALAVVAVVLPGLGDPGADAAWTAVPGQLDRDETLEAARECRETWRGQALDPAPTDAEVTAMTPLVAEHRGDASLVVVGAPGGWVAACLLDGAGSVASLAPPDVVAAAAELAPGEVVAWSGFMSRLQNGDALLALVGRAGADVAAVALHPRDTLGDVDVVQATLRDGWFIAFWPVSAGDAHQDPMRTPLTVTLRTGEVLRDVVLPRPVG